MRCDYAHDDGAYVLGALSPAERSGYERHLAACPACREAVAEIAVLPGLLGRLDSATALQLLADPEPFDEVEGSRPWPVVNRGEADEARVVRLVDRAAQTRRRERRGQRVRFASAVLAAASVAIVAMVGLGSLRGTDPDLGTNPSDIVAGGTPTTSVPTVKLAAMKSVSRDVPVQAAIGMETRGWGTHVVMECVYEKTDRNDGKQWKFRLKALGSDGESEQIASWTASPGEAVHIDGTTTFVGSQLVGFLLTRWDGTPVLKYEVT